MYQGGMDDDGPSAGGSSEGAGAEDIKEVD